MLYKMIFLPLLGFKHDNRYKVVDSKDYFLNTIHQRNNAVYVMDANIIDQEIIKLCNKL